MPAAVPWMIGLMVAGTAIDVYGTIKGGNAQKKAGQTAKDYEDYNASIAEEQATDAEARGAVEESRFRQVIAGTIGQQRAGFAGQGVDVGSGSALDVQADAAYLGELDALTMRNDAAREAYGYRVEAERARKRGKYALQTGQAAQDASRIRAVGTIAGSALTALQIKYGYGRRSLTT